MTGCCLSASLYFLIASHCSALHCNFPFNYVLCSRTNGPVKHYFIRRKWLLVPVWKCCVSLQTLPVNQDVSRLSTETTCRVVTLTVETVSEHLLPHYVMVVRLVPFLCLVHVLCHILRQDSGVCSTISVKLRDQPKQSRDTSWTQLVEETDRCYIHLPEEHGAWSTLL